MIGYLDLPSGISGDMFLGCLVDCGWPVERLRAVIEAMDLPAGEWAVHAEHVQKGPLRATRVEADVQEGPHHRYLADVKGIIAAAKLPAAVKASAIAVFARLANAEAKVHGTTPEEIHFHEVGALDAIVDIVGSVAGLHELGIDRLYASSVPLSQGWAQTQHGKLPLPAPATLELLAAASAPTYPGPGPGEWVTPTGAALLAELATFEQPPMTLARVGTGAGLRDCEWPNVARLWLGEPEAQGAMVQLETNIDDMNPQFFPAVGEKLLSAGARDVWLTPIQMKKGRPAVILSVLAPAALETALADLMLRETTTLGVRVHGLRHRHEARREMREVETSFGTIRVKIKWIGEEPVGVMPEYEDCRAAALRVGVAVRDVYADAAAQAQGLLRKVRESGDRGIGGR